MRIPTCYTGQSRLIYIVMRHRTPPAPARPSNEDAGVPGPDAIVCVSDHGGWAVLVTVASDGTLVDRRNVELVDKRIPSIPHHLEGQTLSIDEAVALVEKVRESADRHAILEIGRASCRESRELAVGGGG